MHPQEKMRPARNIFDTLTRPYLSTLAVWMVAALVLLSAATCGGRQSSASDEEESPTQTAEEPEETPDPEPTPEVASAPEPSPESTPPQTTPPQETPTTPTTPSEIGQSAVSAPGPYDSPPELLGGRSKEIKKYLEMTEEEKYEFIEQRARHVSRMISSGTYEFNNDAIRYIKEYVDAYARRVGNRSKAMWGEDLNFVFGRAQKYAPTIIRAFNERRAPAALGLYIVVVETEYNNISRENFAGAAGLFQFIGPTAEAYGVPRSERTNVSKMAPAAANYMADRIAEFGSDPMSVALGIAGYNRNPDSVRNDLSSVMNSANKERSFWTLVANSDKLDRYFQGENIKYVPKFFAAAIVGETPWAFGLNMKQALSTHTEPVATPDTAVATKGGRQSGVR